ncbi:DUF975 family protein [Sporolactobacillus sp. KGMB 08714]|uniref:DUF975 family protein n=1 Tax=Sporolactobacillus sp. KGMB 08714 TaxID=3064704 RepID=UPI002FBDCFDB
MRILEIKKKARKSLKDYWAVAALLTFLTALIVIGAPYFFEIALCGGVSNWINNWAMTNQTPASVQLIELVYSLVLTPFTFSVCWFYLSLVRSEHPQLYGVFSVYTDTNRSLRLIWASVVMEVYVILWSLLFIIPGIIKGLSYSQTVFILRDHPEYSVSEAITESRRMMDGHKWELFLLNLSFIGWMILSVFLTAFIGLLWVIPYVLASVAEFYDELRSEER